MPIKLESTKLEAVGAGLAALVVAGLVFWWMQSFVKGNELAQVAAAERNLTAPMTLRNEDLKILRVPRQALPKEYFGELNQLVGKTLTKNLDENEIITNKDLSASRDPSSESALVPAGMEGVVLPANWMVAPFPKVKKGDYLSIYVVVPGRPGAEAAAGPVVSGAEILAVVSNKEGEAQSALISLDNSSIERLLKVRAGQYPLLTVVESATAIRGPDSLN